MYYENHLVLTMHCVCIFMAGKKARNLTKYAHGNHYRDLQIGAYTWKLLKQLSYTELMLE